MTAREALIIGGGIGGPVAAMALQRAGIKATIYEAWDHPADYTGWFLNTASNGLDVLHTLGIDLASRADGHPIPNMVMWSGTGKRLGEVANGIGLEDGTVSVCLKRGELQRVLREETLARGIRIEYGKRLIGYEPTGDGGVAAGFEDGTTAEGGLLVGADGIHSATRQLLMHGSPEPAYTGLVGVGGYSRGTAIPPTPNTQHFVFGRRAFFGYLVRESGEIWWFANLARPEKPSSQELATISSQQWKRYLLELFAGDLPLIGEIIGSTGSDIGAHVVEDLATTPVWHRGPVVLIGDAAHATSPNAGQGASLAMEDALVLAKCLRDLPDVERAFAAYERLRRQRAEKIVAYSHRIGRSKTISNPLGVWIRDLVMPFALKRFASPDAHAWIYTYHVDWDEDAHEPLGLRVPDLT
jgi:2-polyprenyl-6-methoxyphenol hydroxylase-like FAD-dependent oxidoreductase